MKFGKSFINRLVGNAIGNVQVAGKLAGGKVAKWATAKRGVERERMKAIPNPWIATFPAGTAAKGE